MSKKHHGGPAPVPPGNRSGGDPAGEGNTGPVPDAGTDTGAPFQDQDPKRRLGNYGGAGEHPRQQPGPLNDGDHHSK